jgi:hypothetical protein
VFLARPGSERTRPTATRSTCGTQARQAGRQRTPGDSMPTRILGFVLLVAGLMFVAFGLDPAQSVVDSVADGASARYAGRTMWYLVGGCISALIGMVVAFNGGRRTELR